MGTENIKHEPLESIVLNCGVCKKETVHTYSGTLVVEKIVHHYGKKSSVQKGNLLNYSCSLCKTEHEIPERRKYGERRRR